MRHLLTTLLVALFAILTGAARADTLVSTSAFNYTGAQQSYVVPSGADYIVIKTWAAGGGEGVVTPGGGGGFVISTFNTSPGLGLTVYVGGGGSGYCIGGWPGGGTAAGLGGAGGGGYSRVAGSGVEVVAGAGGGGGNGYAWSGVGGGGGGPNGQDGGGPGTTYGRGATPSNFGAGGSGDAGAGSAGNYWQGGNSNQTITNQFIGGGGGSGYTGGGGGGTGSAWNGGGGGGGGSCYANQQVSVTYYQAQGNTPGGVGDPDYPGSSIGYGGYESTYANGHNGYVLIRAFKYASAPIFDPPSYSESFNRNQSISYQVHAGGTPAPTYSASNLPTGFSINSSSGVISGQCASPGDYTATVSASNSSGSVQASFACTIVAPQFSASVNFSNSTPIPGEVVTITRSIWAKFGVLKTENNMWKPGGGSDGMGIASATETLSYTVPSGTGTYTYRIRVIDNYSNYTDLDFTFNAVPPLISAPTNVQALTTGSTFVTLTWSGATAQVGIDHYNIYRDGSFLVSSSGTSYTDSTVASSAGYKYQVYVVDLQGHSSGSQTLTITTARALEVFTPLP